MCEWGTDVELEVTIPAHLSSAGTDKRRVVKIDSCIAPLVAALNAAGFATIASCCGHGKHVGAVMLADGRQLTVHPPTECARCATCAREVHDFLAPADTWARVAREFLRRDDAGAGVLCYDCFCVACRALGLPLVWRLEAAA